MSTSTKCDVLEDYYFIALDKTGRERRRADGRFESQLVIKWLIDETHAPFTDVFIISHGWQSDVKGAKSQFEKWIGVMITAKSMTHVKDFKPLVIGLHWPSLFLGDERILTDETGHLLSRSAVEKFANDATDTKGASDAVKSIITSAGDMTNDNPLPNKAAQAYKRLFAQSKLRNNHQRHRPGAEYSCFEPEGIIKDIKMTNDIKYLDDIKLADRIACILSPCRQLSFRIMKNRAVLIGETGGNRLLRHLRKSAPNVKFHLMGHSFGCIVASAMIAGPPKQRAYATPVHSLFLVQGALSLWSYASKLPQMEGTTGYFHRIVKEGLVSGPILATYSDHDDALGTWYRMAATIYRTIPLRRATKARTLELPVFGAVGTFGIQGWETETKIIEPKTLEYSFLPETVYNLNATKIIKEGNGISGAHSDIAHDEIAHAFWAAVLTKCTKKRKRETKQEDVRLETSKEGRRSKRARDGEKQ